ncbi:hypothetical protein [Thermostichus vulcanus]|uniref:Uncharacterized protein n=1 Tax=Thermostichus vulcanus str. 'Rupite' TaxID=2813851 RepID=A0ABT0C825_THEVL|nr:hypothetical protein [Thermostichus vulcanus]MCJ2541928.1 hypothetical protein [Thermostichus vulcanus str. 'Rupite']
MSSNPLPLDPKSQQILAAVYHRARQMRRGLTRQEIYQLLTEATGGTS